MNHHPLHINDVYASQSQQGQNVVVGPLVYSLAVGMTVSDVSGKAIANLATEELSHPNPVFHGDTLYCESEVLEVRPSQSKPDRGVVKVHTRVYKQTGELVAEFKRAVLVPRTPEAIARRPPMSARRRRDGRRRHPFAALVRERGGVVVESEDRIRATLTKGARFVALLARAAETHAAREARRPRVPAFCAAGRVGGAEDRISRSRQIRLRWSPGFWTRRSPAR